MMTSPVLVRTPDGDVIALDEDTAEIVTTLPGWEQTESPGHRIRELFLHIREKNVTIIVDEAGSCSNRRRDWTAHVMWEHYWEGQ